MAKKLVYFAETTAALSGAQTVPLDVLDKLDILDKLAASGEYEVFYVNHRFEADAARHKGTRISFIDIDECDWPRLEDAVIIVPAVFLSHLAARAQTLSKARVLLYFDSVDAMNNLAGQLELSSGENELTRLLGGSESCVFLDKRCYIGAKEAGLSAVTPEYIRRAFDKAEAPELLPSDELCPHYRRENDKRISIGWLGAVDGKALGILTRLADSLCNLRLSELEHGGEAPKLEIHVVGTGSVMWKMDFPKYSPLIRFVYTGNLKGAESCRYLHENADVVLCCDENALLAAYSGIPVAIPATENKPVDNETENRYLYLSDTDGYSLSGSRAELETAGCRLHTIEEILHDIYVTGQKRAIADSCMKRAQTDFSYEAVTRTLVECTRKRRLLTLEDIRSCAVISAQLSRCAEFKAANPHAQYGDYLNSRRGIRFTYAPPRAEKPPFKRRAKNFLKIVLPHNLIYTRFYKVQHGYAGKVKRLSAACKSSGRIKVAFLVVFNSVFPIRTVFEDMLRDDAFDPYIIIAPNVSRTYQYQLDVFNEAYDNLSAQYPDRVIKGYEERTDEYYELGSQYNIVFFANPYKHMVHPFHEIEYFLDKDVLTLYANYGFAAIRFWDEVLVTDFYNYLWRVCLETQSNLKYLRAHQQIKGRNGIVTGYLKMDKLAAVKPRRKKRRMIMICPHHTVWGWKTLDISNFLKYSELFVELPKRYPDIDFVFRPHPLMFRNLVEHCIWTQEEVDSYLERMLASGNIVYDTEGSYMDTFVNSDAMIHDCGSFIGEYLYTEKPCCYMLKSEDAVKKTLLPLGQECMAQYYHAFEEKDIIDFIEQVVVKGNDPMKKSRERFSREVLKVNYPNAAEGVLRMLKETLGFKDK